MARIEKYQKRSIGNLLAHMERRQKYNKETKEMEYVKFGNRDIDTRWSPLNWRVWPPLPKKERDARGISVSAALQELFDSTGYSADESPLQRFRRLFRETPHSSRKDLVCVCDWCISLPDEIPCDRMGVFFDCCMRYCARKYGSENIIGAWVHVDEAHRPHLDVLFVPVSTKTTKNEDGSTTTTKRICAKDVINRGHLSSWHGGLETLVKQVMGIEEPGILNGRTVEEGGNRTVKQMKAHDKKFARTKGKEIDKWRSEALKRLEKAEKRGETKVLDNVLVSAQKRAEAPLKEPRKRTLSEIIKGR